jgi:hypothetical protein
MSYPEPKYFGDGGEVNANLRRGDEPPTLINSAGSTHYLATGADTGGEFGLYRWNFGTGRSGPDTHFHRTMFTPGAPREEYFEWLVEIGRGERSLSEEERAQFYRRHDTYWV